jgi:hypothetical protein
MTNKGSKGSNDLPFNVEPEPTLSLFEKESPELRSESKTEDGNAIATSHDRIPDFYSSGLVASWLGVGTTSDGHIALYTPEKAAASAKGHSSNPVVLILNDVPLGVTTAIPWSEVKEVVFASEKAASEFSARPYANFDPTQLNITFDPNLFSESSENFSEEGKEPENWPLVNRIAGAIAAMNQVSILGDASKASVLRDEITNALFTVDSGDPAQNGLFKVLSPLLSDQDDDAVLLSTLLLEILALDPQKPLGGRTFIRSIIKAHSESSEIVDSLSFTEKILLGKRELPDFSPDKGLRSSKALLLFLLREEPDEVLSWQGQTVNDPLSSVLAAAFSGFRSGWKRFPTSLRVDPILCTKIQAELASSCQEGVQPPWGAGLPPLKSEIVYAFEKNRNTLLSLLASFEEKDWNSSLIVRSLRELDREELVTTIITLGSRSYHWDGTESVLSIEGAVASTWLVSSEIFFTQISSTPEASLEPSLEKLLASLQNKSQ